MMPNKYLLNCTVWLKEQGLGIQAGLFQILALSLTNGIVKTGTVAVGRNEIVCAMSP